MWVLIYVMHSEESLAVAIVYVYRERLFVMRSVACNITRPVDSEVSLPIQYSAQDGNVDKKILNVSNAEFTQRRDFSVRSGSQLLFHQSWNNIWGSLVKQRDVYVTAPQFSCCLRV